MELRKFRQIDNIIGAALLLVASFVYLSTIEPTTSFWDCGEFIASSYKLEIGHPPGNLSPASLPFLPEPERPR